MTTTNEYPLFPELTEQGAIEANKLIEKFKGRLATEARKIIEETISEAYADIMPYIRSDSWSNFRNEMMEGFKNYNNRKIQGEYDFKTIRQEIYKEFKTEIDKDLDQDNLSKISELEKSIQMLQEQLTNSRRILL